MQVSNACRSPESAANPQEPARTHECTAASRDGSRTVCFFDGACPGNQFAQKGPMNAAFVIGEMESVHDVPDLQTPDGPMRSNNIAEYRGLLLLLRQLQDLDRQRSSKGSYLVCGDSELVIRQMRGTYRVRTSHLVPLHAEAVRLSSGLDVEFREVPREKNRAGFLLEKNARRRATREN